MSISQRKHRALILEYHDAGTEGNVDSTYLVKASPSADLHWWCSRGVLGGREVTTGMQPDHRTTVTFGFSAAAPVAVDDAIICNSQSFKVTFIGPRDYGHDEVQVDCERIVEQVLTT
jgi:hypothetical protein